MKRILAAVLVLGTCSFVGCEDKTEVEKKTTIETPTGSAERTDTTTIKTDGDVPPATAPAPGDAGAMPK